MRVLEDAPTRLGHMISRRSARLLLVQGHKKYEAFKETERKNFKLLDIAIAKYQEAITEARSLTPRYHTGCIMANIFLADCHLELSHHNKLTPSEKMEKVKEAERCNGSTLQMAVRREDVRWAQRARFNKVIFRLEGL